MSLDDLLTERLEAVVRKVLDERLGQLEQRIEQLRAGPPPRVIDDDEEISLAECKRLSGYAIDTLRRWIADGKLPARKGAKEWRVRRGDLRVKLGEAAGPLSVVDIRSKVEKMLAGGRK